jgi:hypothetical protein
MNEIRVVQLQIGSTRCYSCGKQAELNVGRDYDVCDEVECLERAIEEKEADNEYTSRCFREIMGQSMYENRLNK